MEDMDRELRLSRELGEKLYSDNWGWRGWTYDWTDLPKDLKEAWFDHALNKLKAAEDSSYE